MGGLRWGSRLLCQFSRGRIHPTEAGGVFEAGVRQDQSSGTARLEVRCGEEEGLQRGRSRCCGRKTARWRKERTAGG